jgi:hypothetical protein
MKSIKKNWGNVAGIVIAPDLASVKSNWTALTRADILLQIPDLFTTQTRGITDASYW